jgi:hypothetical protein
MLPPLALKAKMRSLNPNGKWIQDVVEAPTFKKGAFTGKARKAGHTAKEYMRLVLEDPSDFSPENVRQARFMQTLMGLNK